MEYREWKKILLPYEVAVEELKAKFKNIRKEYQSRGEYSPIEFVTGRIKKITSILDKAKKLEIPVDQIPEKMEDIAGIRVVCQLVDDIYSVVDLIHKRTDMTVLYEKDYISNYKESGYRSYHVIVQYTVQTLDGAQDILAEIQIRTLAMNFWATIEHSLKYKYNKEIPIDLQERLRTAADAAFILDNEMRAVRDEIIGAQVYFSKKSMAVKDALDGIRVLYDKGYEEEALIFQQQIDTINQMGNVEALAILQSQIEQMVYQITRKEIEDK